jgi:hypothetical protein
LSFATDIFEQNKGTKRPENHTYKYSFKVISKNSVAKVVFCNYSTLDVNHFIPHCIKSSTIPIIACLDENFK